MNKETRPIKILTHTIEGCDECPYSYADADSDEHCYYYCERLKDKPVDPSWIDDDCPLCDYNPEMFKINQLTFNSN
ncbi:MAG: hypothetical protein V3V00_15870 [Saprospiraceae bacterium]